MESICDIGDTERSLVYISEEIRGGIAVVVFSVGCGGDDAKGYLIPNSEKHQSRMSVLEEVSPTEMTGLRSTAAENSSGNRPITEKEEKEINHIKQKKNW